MIRQSQEKRLGKQSPTRPMQCDYIIHQLLLGLLSDQQPPKQSGYDAKKSSCTSAELSLEGRVLGEVEKNNCITLPDRGGHSGLMTSKTACPHPGDLVRIFIAQVQRARLMIRIRVYVSL